MVANGEPYVTVAAATSMERFAVKRGLVKSIGGNAGLAKLATNYFENINVDAEGVFTGSYGLLVSVQGSYDASGKLAVDVQQLKGGDLAEFLDREDGRDQACLLYTSPSPRDISGSRMPSSA